MQLQDVQKTHTNRDKKIFLISTTVQHGGVEQFFLIEDDDKKMKRQENGV